MSSMFLLKIYSLNLGYDTVKALTILFGLKDSRFIIAEGLDARPNDVEAYNL